MKNVTDSVISSISYVNKERLGLRERDFFFSLWKSFSAFNDFFLSRICVCVRLM